MKTRLFWGAAAGALALLAAAATADACTRAVYLGRDGLVITGRTMDWKEEIGTNLYLFPRGMERAGYDRDTTLRWRAKYGSVVASAYDFATCDGMNEAGLVASLLFLPESDYGKQGKRPVMGIAMWTQYVLDNFGTVSEAVGALRGDGIYIDAPDMPNGTKSRLHLAISDATGDSAILEYIDGRLRIHEGRQCRVMTNSPRYDLQLAVNDYWEAIGGLKMLPGTNRSSDRFARASFYIGVIPQTADAAVGVPAVLSVMRNVSVPFDARPAPYLLDALAFGLRSEEQGLLFRGDDGAVAVLGRSQSSGFVGGRSRAAVNAHRRGDVCGRRDLAVRRLRAVRIPLPAAEAVICVRNGNRPDCTHCSRGGCRRVGVSGGLFPTTVRPTSVSGRRTAGRPR